MTILWIKRDDSTWEQVYCDPCAPDSPPATDPVTTPGTGMTEKVKVNWEGWDPYSVESVANPIHAALGDKLWDVVSVEDPMPENSSMLFRGFSGITYIPKVDASRVTEMINAFSSCYSLREVGLYGYRVHIAITDAQMGAEALNRFFEQAGTPIDDQQIINVSGNPGSADCDPSIAESKGWNVYR